MRLRVGTSGFAYKEWKGSFYPEKLAASAMLGYYAERFDTVEINNTFYRLPSAKLLEGWAQEVPAGFCFVIKASRRITHIKRLKDVEEPLAFLLDSVRSLGDKLGPLLFQLPPNLKCDLARLDTFLAALPLGLRVALEFREPSWHSDEVYARLRERGVALVAVEADSPAIDSPLVATCDWGYLRLRRAVYSDSELRAWWQRLVGAELRSAYVFFKHEDEGTGPRLAARLREIAGSEPAR